LVAKKFFDKTFTPEIRKRKIGIEELREKLEQQQINGEKAEQFIMDFEQKRLKNKEIFNGLLRMILL